MDTLLSSTTTAQQFASSFITKWKVSTHASRTSDVLIDTVNSASTVTSLTVGGEGFLKLRPITATAASAITPEEGMIVMVSSTNGTFAAIGFYGYANGAWVQF